MSDAAPSPVDLRELLGDIDIYVFDQIMKGRFPSGGSVLDAGCGSGRNVQYLIRAGYDVWAVDQDAAAVEGVAAMASAAGLPEEQFQVAGVDALPFPDARFDVVICSAVLHFASNTKQFDAMASELWRVLRPGGVLFTRLASSIGMAEEVSPVGGGWYHLPDGTDRYLVDAPRLMELTERLGGTLLDPIKTTNVLHQRAMTTWVVGK